MTAKLTRGSVHSPASHTPDPDGPPLTDEDREGMRRVAMVKELRWKLALTQEEFAAAYVIPLETLRAWERRQAEPSAEMAYLRAIERNPEVNKLVPA